MKRLLCSLLLPLLLWTCSIPVSAASDQPSYTQYGTDCIAVNDTAAEFLEEQGISFSDPESIQSLSIDTVFQSFLAEIKAQTAAPFQLLLTLVTICILSALLGGIGDSLRDKSMHRIYEVVCVLVCVSLITEPVSACFAAATDAIADSSQFMLAFVPVFTTVLAAGGGIVTATSYQMLVLTLAELTAQLAAHMLLPLLQMALALSIVDAVHPALELGGLIQGLKKCVTWGLGLLMAGFVGLLSIQSAVGASADGVTTKATRFVLSSCIPVVGSAVSDAFSTVRGSLGILRSGVGGIGILALTVTVLPAIVQLGLYRLTLASTGMLADILQIPHISRLLHNLEAILSIAFGMLISITFLLLIATAMVMLICGS